VDPYDLAEQLRGGNYPSVGVGATERTCLASLLEEKQTPIHVEKHAEMSTGKWILHLVLKPPPEATTDKRKQSPVKTVPEPPVDAVTRIGRGEE
jgi:hypothetical protein